MECELVVRVQHFFGHISLHLSVTLPSEISFYKDELTEHYRSVTLEENRCASAKILPQREKADW